MRMITSFLLFISPLLGDTWLEDVSKRIDPEAISWMREKIKNNTAISKEASVNTIKKQCHSKAKEETEPSLIVFISTSVPEGVWVTLSKELEKLNGVFVLKGLPSNSFKELSKTMQKLINLGVAVPIQINPRLFKEFSVESVPCIVIQNGTSYDKISGNISVSYALERMIEKGETGKAPELLKILRGNDV